MANVAPGRLPRCLRASLSTRQASSSSCLPQMTHDAIHDMAHPSAVLRAVQKATLPGGCWIIGDMASLER